MPAAIGTWAATAILGEALVGTALFVAIEVGVALLVTAGINYLIGEVFKQDLPSIGQTQRGLKQTVRSAIGSQRIIYGSTVVGGQLVYASTSGVENIRLDMIIVHAAHEVSHFGEMYFGDSLVTDRRHNLVPITQEDIDAQSNPRIDTIRWDSANVVNRAITVDGKVYSNPDLTILKNSLPVDKFTSVITATNVLVLTGVNDYPVTNWELKEVLGQDSSGNWHVQSVTNWYQLRYFAIETFNGAANQIAAQRLMTDDVKWTSQHRLRGHAYTHVRLGWNADVWLTGIPQYKVRVFGKRLYHPSILDYKYSDNWALCVRDYLTADYGLKCTDNDINIPYMDAAIATSDEELTTPGPGNYYLMRGGRLNGWRDNVLVISGIGVTRHTLFSTTSSTYYPQDDTEIILWDAFTEYENLMADISADGKYLTLTPITAPDLWMSYFSKSYWFGATYPLIKVRLKRTAGTTFIGYLVFHVIGTPEGQYDYYSNTPTWVGDIDVDYVTVIWDLTTVYSIVGDVASTAYVDNFIDRIRFKLDDTLTSIFVLDWIAITRPSKRYTCNGGVYLDSKPVDILRKMQTAGAGASVYSQGKYKLFAGEYITPTVTLDESDLRSELIINTSKPKDQLYTTVKGAYVEPESFYNAVPFDPIVNIIAIAEYGEESVHEIELPFTYDAYTARRIANIILERNRQYISVIFPAKFTAFQITTLDTVMVSIEKLGWVSKVFRVLNWTLAQDGGVDLVLQEDHASIYDEVFDYVDRAPNTSLPAPWHIKPPINLILASDISQVLITADGSIVSRIYVTWDEEDESVNQFEIQLKKSADIDWATVGFTRDLSFYIPNVIDKISYDVRLKAIGWLDTSSLWVESLAHVVIGKSAPPEDVTGFIYSLQVESILLSWNAVSDVDLDHYEIRRSDVLDTWETATLLGEVKTRQWLDLNPIVETYYYWIKAVDTTGNDSLNASSMAVTTLAPNTPILDITYTKSMVVINWQDCTTNFPIDYYIIKKDSIFLENTSATGYQIEVDWLSSSFGITAVDVNGNVSIETFVVITPILPIVTDITSSVVDNNVLLNWVVNPGSLPADSIELRRGSVFATAEVIGLKTGTFTVIFEPLGGLYTYWLAPLDTAGNYGIEQALTITVNEPPDYVLNVSWDVDFSGRTENAFAVNQIIFGNCFEDYDFADWVATAGDTLTQSTDAYAGTYSGLFQSAEATGDSTGTTDKTYLTIPQLYAEQYAEQTIRVRVRAKKPATGFSAEFAIAYSTNESGNSGWFYFNPTTVWEWYEFEYLVPAIILGDIDYIGIWGDTSGSNNGVLIDLVQIDLANITSKVLVLPTNTIISYEDHFTANGWLTPQDQIDAGFPIYALPACDISTYEQVFDYGTVLNSTRVTIDITKELLNGSVTETYNVALSTDLVNWVNHPNTLQLLANDFRYLKFSIYAASSAGADIISITKMRILLDSKLKTDSGTGVTSPAGGRVHNSLVDHYHTNWIPPITNPDGWIPWIPGSDLIIDSADTPAVEIALANAPNENVWQITPVDDGDLFDGGAYLDTVLPIDSSKMYMSAIFAKRTSGSAFCGCASFVDGVSGGIRMSDGGAATNNWYSGGTPLGWNLIVTILHPEGTAYNPGTETTVAGVYDLTGTKISDGEEYVMPPGTNGLGHRFMLYNSTVFGTPIALFTRPMLRETTFSSVAADVQEILDAALTIGAIVDFGVDYVDISSILATPNSPDNISAIINFYDIPNPTSFTAFLYDSSGNKIEGSFYWIARGY